jgi:hypothetical protein
VPLDHPALADQSNSTHTLTDRDIDNLYMTVATHVFNTPTGVPLQARRADPWDLRERLWLQQPTSDEAYKPGDAYINQASLQHMHTYNQFPPNASP